jgi:putative ABC transport system ATP-binding protein
LVEPLPMQDDTQPSLQGIHLKRSFFEGKAENVVVNDVSLSLYPGQMTLLKGPSGSGKTTLLAILSGLLHPNSGKVTALGQDLWAMSDGQRERFRLANCGFIFQGYNLFASLTARQQLEMVLRWGEGASARVARQRTDAMLSLLGMSDRANARPIELSGGEKQRVAIGRAMIKQPQFCFADEPTSALDWAHGEQVVELLRNAAHDLGATVLCVAHDERILRYADEVFNLEDGQLKDADLKRVEHPFPVRIHDHHTPAPR